MESIFVRQVKAFIERSMYTNALVLCEQYLSAKGVNDSAIDMIYLMGLCYFKMRKYQQAQMVLSKVTTTTIFNSSSLCDDYMLLLAQCTLELGDYSLALSHIQATSFFRAYSVTPYNIGDKLPQPMPNLDAKDPMQGSIIFYTLGKIYKGMKSMESAAAAFVQSLYANPFMFISFKELCDMGYFPVSSSEDVCKTFFSSQSLEKASSKTLTSSSVPPVFESVLNTSSEFKRRREDGKDDDDDDDVVKSNNDKQQHNSQSIPPIAKKARKEDGSEIKYSQTNEPEYNTSVIISTYGRLYNALSQYNLSEFNSVLDSKECPPNMRKSPFVNIMRGKAYLDSNNHLESERLFAQAHKDAPYVLKGMEYYSTTLWRTNKTALLTNLAYSMMSIDKLAPETLCAAGNCFSQRGDHRSALKLFSRAVQVDENYAYAYFLAGDEYSSVDNLDKATASFLLAHDRQPRDVGCLLGLARIMLKRGNRNQANCYFSMALKVDPTSAAAHSYLAVSFLLDEIPEMALKELDLAIKYSPSNTFARVKRVEALLALNKVSEACMELKSLEPLIPVASLSALRAEAARRMKDALTEASAKSAAIDIESGTSRLLKSIRNNHEIITALNNIVGTGRPVSIAHEANVNTNTNAGNCHHSIEQNSLEDSLHMSGRLGPPVVVSSISPPARRGQQAQQQQLPPPPQQRREVAPVRMLNFSDELSSVSDNSNSISSNDSFLLVRPPPSQIPDLGDSQQQQQQQLGQHQFLSPLPTTTTTTATQQQQQQPLQPPPPPQHPQRAQTQRFEFVSGSSPVTRAFDNTPRVSAGASLMPAATSTVMPTVGSRGGTRIQRDTSISGISPLPHQLPPSSRILRGPVFDDSSSTSLSTSTHDIPAAAAAAASSSSSTSSSTLPHPLLPSRTGVLQGAGANTRPFGVIPLNLNSFSSDDSRDEQQHQDQGLNSSIDRPGNVDNDRRGEANLSVDRQGGQGQFPPSSFVTPPTGQPPQTPESIHSFRRRRSLHYRGGGGGGSNGSGIDDGSIH